MILIMVFVGIGRHYVQQLIKSEETADKDVIRYKQTAMKAQRLRLNGNCIAPSAYDMRRVYLCRKKVGLLREKVPGAPNPMSNPSGMMDMMKNQMVFMVPNMVMMAFVDYFFVGFVLVKVPFALPSERFKLMTQRGVDLSSLDVSYVSSLSWYFMVSFGLRGVYRLILGEDSDAADDAKMMQMQMGMGMGGNAANFDASSAYKQERELLLLHRHSFIGNKAEKDLLKDKHPAVAAAKAGNEASAYLDVSKLTSSSGAKANRSSGAGSNVSKAKKNK